MIHGDFRLTSRASALPLNPSAWYLEQESEGYKITYTGPSTTKNETQLNVPLSKIIETRQHQVVIDLELTPTSTNYLLRLCGSVETGLGDALKAWPVNVFMIQRNQEPYS